MSFERLTRRFRTMRTGWLALGAAVCLGLVVPRLEAQEGPVAGTTVSLSSGEATLELELTDGEGRIVSFREGKILVDGEDAGSYEPGGDLERSWRALLADPALFGSASVAGRLANWVPETTGAAEADAAGFLTAFFGSLISSPTAGAAQAETATVARSGGGQVSIAPGVMSLSELTANVDVLRRSLERMGPDAAGLEENLALVVHGDYTLEPDRVVEGNLALLSGDLTLEGTVSGDVLVLDGTLTLAPSATVEGDVLQIGGDVVRSGGSVAGELVTLIAGDLGGIEMNERVPADRIEAPVRVPARDRGPGFFGRAGHNIGHAVGGLLGVIAWLLALSALGAVVVYFFRRRLEIAADTVRADLGRSFGVGLAGQLLVLPILLLLAVGIVTWLVIPVYVLAVALAIPAGYLAVAHATGEAVAERRYDWLERFRPRRQNSYYYVFSGVALLLAPFAIGSALYLLGGMLGFVRGLTFFAAGVVTWGAITTGFGAVILTRGGGRRATVRGVDTEDLFTAPESFDEDLGGEASA